MSVTGTPISPVITTAGVLIDKILEDLGQATDVTAYWSRGQVMEAIDYIQREISRKAENIIATTGKLEPSTSATTITIDSSGLFLRELYAYRVYGGTTREIDFYTREQVGAFDPGWITREASIIRGLITDITAPGIARLYPIPDNGDNDIYVSYTKEATRVTAEHTQIEIPDSDSICLEYGVKARLYDLEVDGADSGKQNFYAKMYDDSLAAVIKRTQGRRQETYRVYQERPSTDGIRTRPYFPWEV